MPLSSKMDAHYVDFSAGLPTPAAARGAILAPTRLGRWAMPGHIRKRGETSWEVTVSLGRDPSTGRWRRRFLTVRGTKRDAERVMAEAVHQRETGIDVSPGKLTLADYLWRWAAGLCGPQRSSVHAGAVQEHHRAPPDPGPWRSPIEGRASLPYPGRLWPCSGPERPGGRQRWRALSP